MFNRRRREQSSYPKSAISSPAAGSAQAETMQLALCRGLCALRRPSFTELEFFLHSLPEEISPVFLVPQDGIDAYHCSGGEAGRHVLSPASFPAH